MSDRWAIAKMSALRRAMRGLLAIIVLAILFALVSKGQTTAPQWANEYELKVAFVYRMLPFVDWADRSAGEHVVVGFAGEGPLRTVLTSSLAGKRVNNRVIDVREVRGRNDMRDCDVLLVAYSDESRTKEALAYVRNANVLTIGFGERFARDGGILALVPRDNTFQLAVNPRAAERSHIKISSKLLAIARLMPDEDIQ